jgi:ketosteroid isomerase-like protein
MKPLSSVSIKTLQAKGGGNLVCTFGEATWVNGRPPNVGATTNLRFVIIWSRESDGGWRVALEMLN